jgi:hypothetical protein
VISFQNAAVVYFGYTFTATESPPMAYRSKKITCFGVALCG